MVGKEFVQRVAGIFRSIFNVISHCGLKTTEEFPGGGAQLLDDLVPLVDVYGRGETRRDG